MHKHIISLAAIALTGIGPAARAQDLYFGISGGYYNNQKVMVNESPLFQVPYLTDEEAYSPQRLSGATWGLQLGYQFSKRWGIETQLRFANEGYKEKLDLIYHFQSGPVSGTRLAELERYRNYHYTRIPLLVHYTIFPPLQGWKIRLMAGPNIGILTQQYSIYKGINELGVEKAGTLNMEDKPLKKTDPGLQAGIRIEKQVFSSFSAFLEGVYYQGFLNSINVPDVAYNEPTPTYYYEKNINRHTIIALGLQYNITGPKKWFKKP